MSIAMQTAQAQVALRPRENPFKRTPMAADADSGKSFDTDADLRALQQVGTKIRFARGETIFNEGDDAEHCYKVVSGAVRLCKHMSDGRRQIADFLLAGDLFGFLQFGTFKFTAEAVSDVVVMSYPQRQVERLSNAMPHLRQRLLFLLSHRLMGMQDHLVMLGRQTAKERVASFLLMLAERSDAEDGTPFETPMSRQDIADYLGLTIETVCRSLSELKRTRVIDIPSLHEIALKNSDALHSMANGEE